MSTASAPRPRADGDARTRRVERLLAHAFDPTGEPWEPAARDAVALAEETRQPSTKLGALRTLARALMARADGDLLKAFELGSEALEGLNEPYWQARVLGDLAVNLSQRGLLTAAEALYDRTLALVRANGLIDREPGLLANLGIHHGSLGDPARAVSDLLEARRLYARQGRARGEGVVLVNIGPFYRILGAYPDAIAALIEGIDLLEGEGLEGYQCTGLANLAAIYAVTGVADEAVRCAREAVERAPPNTPHAVEAHSVLAFACSESRDHEAALQAGCRAVELARELGDACSLADALLRRGDARRRAGNLPEARADYREALALAEPIEFHELRPGIELGLARLHEQEGNVREAFALAKSLVEPLEREGERHPLIELHDLLSRLTETLGDPKAALAHLRRAQELRRDVFRRETDVRIRSIQGARELRRERKQSAEVLRALTQRVMESQEEERRRVASDLHDDLGQRLALLAVELDMLAQRSGEDAAPALETLAEQAQSIADQVHGISRSLHPAHLTQLGLVGAARWVCDEVARVHGIEIDFGAVDVPRRIPDDCALCLYRILQEGLNNATRHADARRATVHFEANEREIRLVLGDEGCGFDPDRLEASGLGLASMRERAHHLGGRFQLHSSPGKGTRIEVTLPSLPPESE